MGTSSRCSQRIRPSSTSAHGARTTNMAGSVPRVADSGRSAWDRGIDPGGFWGWVVRPHPLLRLNGAMSTRTNPIRRTVARHQLTTFFVLTYLLSWWTVPFTEGQLLPYGPSIAAITVLAVGQGRSGLSRLWKQVSHWRVGWRWYVIAPAIIVTYTLIALVVTLMLGATIEGGEVLAVGAIASVVVELTFLGGVWEEPGWSGYSLPTLQGRLVDQRYGLLKASFVMGAARTLWHIPLVVYGHIPWFDAIFLSFALQFVVTWIYNRTGGSLPVVMLTHLSSNVIAGAIMTRLFIGSDKTLYQVVFIAFATLLAFGLNKQGRWSMGRRVESPESVAVTG